MQATREDQTEGCAADRVQSAGQPEDDFDDGSQPDPLLAPPTFAETLFAGSRFVFVCLAPVLVLTGASLLFTVPDWRSWNAAVFVALSLACFLFALALASPRRCAWAARTVTGMVFVACCAYVVAAVRAPGRGDPDLDSALRAMAVFGLPSLWFTLRRRRRVAS